MSESSYSLGVVHKQNPYKVLQIFRNYITAGKPGLKRFYNPDGSDQYLSDCATRGSAVIQQLMENGCPEQVAAGFSLLALWDLVILIGAGPLRMSVLGSKFLSFTSLIDSGSFSKWWH